MPNHDEETKEKALEAFHEDAPGGEMTKRIRRLLIASQYAMPVYPPTAWVKHPHQMPKDEEGDDHAENT